MTKRNRINLYWNDENDEISNKNYEKNWNHNIIVIMSYFSVVMHVGSKILYSAKSDGGYFGKLVILRIRWGKLWWQITMNYPCLLR